MSGLIAYYYDVVRPGVAVELQSCRFNHIGMDNKYRSLPLYKPRQHSEWVGKCRSRRPDCEDCLRTRISDIYVAHYTAQCKFVGYCCCLSVLSLPYNLVALLLQTSGQLPRACVSEGEARGGEDEDLIDSGSGKIDHCLAFNKKWHALRFDLEVILERDVDYEMETGYAGTYKKEHFKGHCDAEGNYLPIENLKKYVDKIRGVYEQMTIIVPGKRN